MATTANAFATASQITAKVGAMVPLGQISSVVQTLSNIQGFNPGAFGQLSGTIQSALQGFDQASSLVQGFASGSPVQAFTSALGATGLAGSSISSIAGASASAYRQADSFLSSVASVQSWQRLNSQRPGVEEARATNRPNSGISFPKDIGKYWIYLGFEEANFSSITSSGTAVYRRKGRGSVTLPVPMNLSDTNQLEYQAIQLTDKALTLGKFATDMAGAMGGASRAMAFLEKFGINNLTQGIGAAAETAGALTGFALNTHQTLKFVQPTLKSHSFSWKLVPSSKEESKILHSMVQFIKSRIYPDKGALTFRYPDLIYVYMYNGDKMYFFKPAYVTGFAVNYTTEGGPAFHNDEYPVSVQIDMNITETAVWTRNDAEAGGY